MDRCFFDTPYNVIQLQAELESWIGTPFYRASRAKGKDGGVDCVHLVQEVYFSLGVIEDRYPMPQYSIDWANHQKKSMLKEYIRTFHANDFTLIEDRSIQPGDLLIINPRGRCAHHAGIVFDSGQFVHALKPSGVIKTQLEGSGYGFKIEEVWRPNFKA
jgi:cell wall-associated NlpC family hydrolase